MFRPKKRLSVRHYFLLPIGGMERQWMSRYVAITQRSQYMAKEIPV